MSEREKSFKPGDAVTWKSQGRTIEGHVKKKLTHETRIKGHRVAASAENPELLVESDATGAKAAHKPAALRKR